MSDVFGRLWANKGAFVLGLVLLVLLLHMNVSTNPVLNFDNESESLLYEGCDANAELPRGSVSNGETALAVLCFLAFVFVLLGKVDVDMIDAFRAKRLVRDLVLKEQREGFKPAGRVFVSGCVDQWNKSESVLFRYVVGVRIVRDGGLVPEFFEYGVFPRFGGVVVKDCGVSSGLRDSRFGDERLDRDTVVVFGQDVQADRVRRKFVGGDSGEKDSS